MFDRFTATARRVVVLAERNAIETGQSEVDSDHLLLALLDTRAEAPTIAAFFAEIAIDKAEFRDAIILTIDCRPVELDGLLPFTRRCKDALEYAMLESRDAEVDSIGPEHLLLGVLRDGSGTAAQALVSRGVDLGSSRTVMKQIHAEVDPRSAAPEQSRGMAHRFLKTMRAQRNRRELVGGDPPRVWRPSQVCQLVHAAGSDDSARAHLFTVMRTWPRLVVTAPTTVIAQAVALPGIGFDELDHLERAIPLGDRDRRRRLAADISSRLISARTAAKSADAKVVRLLTEHAHRLIGLDRNRELAAVLDQIVTLYRRLDHTSRDSYTEDFALALAVQAETLWILDRRAEAVECLHQSCTRYQKLSVSRPTHLETLGSAAGTLSTYLTELGNGLAALEAAEDAVAAWRRLAAQRVGPWFSALAEALLRASDAHATVGNPVDALATAEEAAAILFRLAKTHPETHADTWIEATATLAAMLYHCGEYDDAVAASRVVVRHHRERLIHDSRNLATALCDCARYLLASNAGRHPGGTWHASQTSATTPPGEQAYESITESMTLHQRAYDTDDDSPRVSALHVLAESARVSGRGVEALAAARAAYQATAKYGDHAPPHLRALHAESARILSRCVPRADTNTRIVALARESVAVFCELVDRDLVRWRPQLAVATHDLAVAYLETRGDREYAIATATEAVKHLMDLRRSNPTGVETTLQSAIETLDRITR